MASEDQKQDTVLPIVGSKDEPNPQDDARPLLLPIIDSHVHLWRDGDLPKMNWWKPDATRAGMEGPRTLARYKEDAASTPSLLGYVVLECDVKSDLDPAGLDGAGWDLPLEELAGWARVALGEAEDGDGAGAEDGRMCLGILPWAPLPAGPEVMEKYIARVQEVAGDAWPKVKGFRYLVQDKPHGVMIEDKFIQSLKLLGRKGLVFDVGVDHHRRGRKQLDELLSMVDMAHEGVPEEEKVKFIISKSHPPIFTSQQHKLTRFILQTTLASLTSASSTSHPTPPSTPGVPLSTRWPSAPTCT